MLCYVIDNTISDINYSYGMTIMIMIVLDNFRCGLFTKMIRDVGAVSAQQISRDF